MSATIPTRRPIAPLTQHEPAPEANEITNTPEDAPDQPEVNIDAGLYVEKELPLPDHVESEYSPVDELVTLYNNVDHNRACLATLYHDAWNVELSRETVYLFGQLEGRYTALLVSLNKDVQAARNG